MEISLYLSFCLAAFLLALMPGPDNIFVLTESIAKGAKNGILISLGLNLGVLVHTLAAATGITLILQESEFAFSVVQYAGAAYLIYLAYQAARDKMEEVESKESTVKGDFKLVRTGFIMNVVNPKVSLFFIAFLPQFIRPESGSVINQMLLMGVSFLVIGFLTFSSFALLANQLRKPLSSPSFLKGVKWAKVSVLLALAVFLLIP